MDRIHHPDEEQFSLMLKIARDYADKQAPIPTMSSGYAQELVIWHEYHGQVQQFRLLYLLDQHDRTERNRLARVEKDHG